MPFVKIGELFGNYLIVIDKAVAMLGLVLLVMGGLAVAWVANIPQPTPNWSRNEEPKRPRHRR